MTHMAGEAHSGQYQPLGTTTPAGEGTTNGGAREWSFITEDGAQAQVALLAEDLARVRLIPPGQKVGRSWAVAREEWPEVRVRTDAGENGMLRVTTDAMRIEIAPSPFRVAFSWPDGAPFAVDDPQRGMGMVPPLGPTDIPDRYLPPGMLRCYKQLAPGEHLIGAAERTTNFDLRGQTITFWNVDPPLHHNVATGPMYASIPFWMGLHSGRAYGIFVDSAWHSDLDAGASLPDVLSFGVAGGELTYYVFAGPDPQAILARYADLTGHMPLPPRWALGYGQSRWSYFPAAHLRDVADGLREHRIPADHLWLDIDYMDGYRVFTWNTRRFPQPERMLSELAAQGFKVVTIIDPGVKVDPTYPVFTEGLEKNYFVRQPDGALSIGLVWPGECAFPDFSRAEVREWWGRLHSGLLDAGIAGVWDDMNEPGMTSMLVPGAGTIHGGTLPLEALHLPDGPDGEPMPHAAFHNAYGMQMARASFEGQQALRPDKRPFVLTRSGYAGVQRYAAIWTGDNDSAWDHIRMAARMCLMLGVTGIPFAGFDTGGFWGNSDGELLVRFTQLGAVMPFYRNHSAMRTVAQEPWAFGQPWEAFCQQTIELRYQLIPYLYTAFAEAARTGAPIARPLVYAYPEETGFANIDDEHLLGPDLLAAPVMDAGGLHRDVVFPREVWVDWYSGERFTGPSRVTINAPLDIVPLFAREGAIIPLAPVMQYTDQRPEDPLTLTCYLGSEAGATATGTLYEDDGETPAWQQGEWRLTRFTAERTTTGVTFHAARPEGGYTGEVREWLVELHLPYSGGTRPAVSSARLGNQSLGDDWETVERRYETVVRIPVGRIVAPFELAINLR